MATIEAELEACRRMTATIVRAGAARSATSPTGTPDRVEVDGMPMSPSCRTDGRGLRDPRHVLARRRPAVRGRGRRLHDRVLAARLELRPAHRQAVRPARDASPSPYTPSRSTADDVLVSVTQES